MARTDAMGLALKVGVVYGIYYFGKQGYLGDDIKKLFTKVSNPPGPGQPGGGGGGGSQPTGGLPPSYRGMNNFGAIMNQWRQERREVNLDPRDWEAAKRHLTWLHLQNDALYGSGVPGDWAAVSQPPGW